MPDLPILYSFRRCPYAMRARMALRIAAIDFEHRAILLKDKPQEMLDASPKGTVPVLVLADGRVLEESIDIMRWALAQNDPQNWLDADPEQTNALITANDGDFKKNLDRYKYPSRYPDEDCSMAEENCMAYLRELETLLNKNKFLLGAHPTLADIALFPFVRQFSFVDKEKFEKADLPNLQSWRHYFLKSELFQTIMKKRPIWKTPDIIA